tara:strand:+ start:455 stop:661 length:207 start_codon:yes stop_codon:yes gene_type:complete
MKVGDLIRIREDPKNRPGQEEHIGVITKVLLSNEEHHGRGMFEVMAFRPTTGRRFAFGQDIEMLNESG